jgi:hypothetical protein
MIAARVKVLLIPLMNRMGCCVVIVWIVGKALTLLILDEFWLLNANEQQEVINKIIPTQATIGAYKEKHNGATIKYGKVAIFSTPRNPKLATPAGRMFAKAEHPNEFPEYIYSRYDADSNPLITPEVLEADRQLMTEADFMQEYYLIFPDEGTRVLRSFKESKHIIKVDNLETLKNRDDLYMVIGTDDVRCAIFIEAIVKAAKGKE